MIVENKIETLVNGFLEGSDKFVMDVQVKAGNIIMIAIDGDSLVNIDDCIQLSRAIEGSLDRDLEDFELRVSSYGADKPLLHPRQYPKHIGRSLDITRMDESLVSGKLVEADGEGIRIEKKKKKKQDPDEDQILNLRFDIIKEAKIILSFK